MHQPHAAQAQDVRNLVRVDEHRGGAVRHDRLHEAADRQHAAFDVHVTVAETGNHEGVRRPR